MVGNLDKPGVGGGSFSCRKKKIKTEVLFLGQCFALESNLLCMVLWYHGHAVSHTSLQSMTAFGSSDEVMGFPGYRVSVISERAPLLQHTVRRR